MALDNLREQHAAEVKQMEAQMEELVRENVALGGGSLRQASAMDASVAPSQAGTDVSAAKVSVRSGSTRRLKKTSSKASTRSGMTRTSSKRTR